MIPELGHFALVLALALGLIQSIVPMVGARQHDAALMRIGSSTALMQFVCVMISFLALIICYVTSDFSVATVYENSHSMMPLVYKITSVWGSHEGSTLLWVLILSLFGALVALFGLNLPTALKAHVLSVQSWIACIRLYHKPMVLLIWLGGVVMALDGALSLSDRRLRIGAPKPAANSAMQPGE